MAKTNTKTNQTSVASVGDAFGSSIKDALTDEQRELVAEKTKATDTLIEETNKVLDVVQPPAPIAGSLEHDTKNAPTFAVMIAGEIAEHFKGTGKSIVEASADAREALSTINNSVNEIEGSGVTRLTLDFADILSWLLKAEKPEIGANPECHKDFVALLKAKGLLGKPEQLMSAESGLIRTRTSDGQESKSTAVVELVSPFTGPTAATINDAAMGAWLVVLGHRTGVQIGYIRKDETAGKRFNKTMVFLRADQIDMDKLKEYHRSVCIPTRVVAPYIYETRFDSANKINRLVPAHDKDGAVEMNMDNSLRHITSDWRYALFMHYFAEVELAYDCEATGGKLPTGLLMKMPKATRAPQVPRQQQALPDTLDKAHDVIKTQQSELRKAREGNIGANIDSPELRQALVNFGKAMNDIEGTKQVSVGTLEAALIASVGTIRRISKRYANTELPHILGSHMTTIETMLQLNLAWNGDDWVWNNEAGNKLNTIKELEDTAAVA